MVAAVSRCLRREVRFSRCTFGAAFLRLSGLTNQSRAVKKSMAYPTSSCIMLGKDPEGGYMLTLMRDGHHLHVSLLLLCGSPWVQLLRCAGLSSIVVKGLQNVLYIYFGQMSPLTLC